MGEEAGESGRQGARKALIDRLRNVIQGLYIPRALVEHVAKSLRRYFHRSFAKQLKRCPSFFGFSDTLGEILLDRVLNQIIERSFFLCRFCLTIQEKTFFDKHTDFLLHFIFSVPPIEA